MADSLDLIQVEARAQFGSGDAALEIEPLRSHGGHLSIDDEQLLRVEASLRLSADRLGLSFYTVRTQRWVAAQWPAEYRQDGVSYEVHRVLACWPDRFELIRNPPLNERTGLRQWTGEVAKKAVGWKNDSPASAQETVAAVHELVQGDESVAAQVATDFLRLSEVAFRAMRDTKADQAHSEPQWVEPRLLISRCTDQRSIHVGANMTTPNPEASAAGPAPSDSDSALSWEMRPDKTVRAHGFSPADSASKKRAERRGAAADVASEAWTLSEKGFADLKRSASKRSAEARDATAAALTRTRSQIGRLVRRASNRLSGGSSTTEADKPQYADAVRELANADAVTEVAMLAAAENRYARLSSPSSPLKVVNASPSASSTSISMADAARIPPSPGRPPSSGSEHRTSATPAQAYAPRSPSRQSSGR
ncbi:hypothetical protein EHS43_24380 [Streptomyces sp. RP5T]|nr:hypothetical protein EHS43_24380 [Streptomyces sp. RP5T]